MKHRQLESVQCGVYRTQWLCTAEMLPGRLETRYYNSAALSNSFWCQTRDPPNLGRLGRVVIPSTKQPHTTGQPVAVAYCLSYDI